MQLGPLPLPATAAPTTAAPRASPHRVEVFDGAQLAAAAGALPADVRRRMDSISQFDALARAGRLPAPVATDGGTSTTNDPAVRDVLRHAVTVNRYLDRVFQRDGWDGRGTPLRVVVHARASGGVVLRDAAWDRRAGIMLVGDSAGADPHAFARAGDVFAHEVMHGVFGADAAAPPADVDMFSQLFGRAVGESWADVLATSRDGDWVIGESLQSVGLPARDLRNPAIRTTADLSNVADAGEHQLAGVPTTAAVLTSDAIGRDAMLQTWYRAIPALDAASSFADAAAATIHSARTLFGEGSAQSAAVEQAWRSVGVASPAGTAAG